MICTLPCTESEFLVPWITQEHWGLQQHGGKVKIQLSLVHGTGLQHYRCHCYDHLWAWWPLKWNHEWPAWPYLAAHPWKEHLLSIPGLVRTALKATKVGWLLSYPSAEICRSLETIKTWELRGCSMEDRELKNWYKTSHSRRHCCSCICWFVSSWDFPLAWPAQVSPKTQEDKRE